MKLANYIHKDLIIPELSARTKSEVLAEMVDYLKKFYSELDREKLYELLIERESLGTTGIGSGIAIPHTKVNDLDQLIVLVGRSLKGVDFDALDKEPVHIIFLLLASDSNLGEHLRVLAYISRLLKDEIFKKEFLSAKNKDELYLLLKDV
ncbi:MAG: PTS sugar transporter subunit IIA [Desulfonauticus sp.]|nr:PTS sugar transporter subunit IIA [Desulfonauticus sp.]